MGDRYAARKARPKPPVIPSGTVLHLGAGDWRYGTGPLTLRVDRVRDDLAHYYDDEVWVEGYRIDEAGVAVEWLQALVRVVVLAQEPTEPPRPRAPAKPPRPPASATGRATVRRS